LIYFCLNLHKTNFFMIKNQNLAIVASFFGLWIDSFFSNKIQIIIGFALIFSFGILHGANDLLLIQKIGVQKNTLSLVKLTLYYVIVVLLGVILFYVIPWFALILFIFVSAYHFGEQQWQKFLNKYNKRLIGLYHLIYGLFILLLLFTFHTNEVQNIVSAITGILFLESYIPLLLKIVGSILILFFVYFSWNSIKLRKKIAHEIFYLIVFTILFMSSSLIWGFALYFVLWHSIPSIIDQIKFLNGSYSRNNFINYCKSALIYWLISLLSISILYYFFKDEKIFNALFFSFLAAITFPHALVILKMFDRK
jgi:beta-carotene 15,15'-dioxygenase